jgi:hypothetical protein
MWFILAVRLFTTTAYFAYAVSDYSSTYGSDLAELRCIEKKSITAAVKKREFLNPLQQIYKRILE